jgi:hypothetical protein
MTLSLNLSGHVRIVAILTAIAISASSSLFADAPSAAYIFPAGGQRGQTVEIRVGGHYLHGDCPFEMLGGGIEAPKILKRAGKITWFEGPVIPLPDSQKKEDYPWEHTGSVKIAPDAPLGFRRWRVWTSQGVTPTMKFVVGDLPELVEVEVAGEPLPRPVVLPITINGRIFPREDVDVWTFKAQAGSSYVCEVVAARIGSSLDSRLEIRNPQGQPVAENVDTFGHDSFVRFTAKETGNYQVRIHDVNFDGLQHFVYRLTVTDGPHVERVFPLGGQRGTATPFTVSGQLVPEEPFVLTLPQITSASYPHRFNIDGRASNTILLDVGDAPEQIEAEPNDNASDAPVFELPAVLNGTIEKRGDVDAWQFEAKKDEQLVFEVRAASLGSRLDSVIAVYDEAGKELGTNDDRGKTDADSQLSVKIPQDGRYRITIRDRFVHRGGTNFAYRIYAGPAKEALPGFDVALPVDGLTLLRGAETKIKFTTIRRGGFQGSIELRFDGLPKGVEVAGNVIAEKKNDTQVVFKVEATAPINLQHVRVSSVATVAEQQVMQPIVQSASSGEDLEVDHIAMAVAIPTPFKVVGAFETRYADRGSTFTRHYSLERDGYAGPIQIRLAERQVRHLQGVTGQTIDIPMGQDEFDFRVKLPPWMEIGRTSRTCVMAVAEIKDETGKTHTVSYTSHAQNDQVIILVDPGQLDLKLEHQSLTAREGTTRELAVEVARGRGISGDVRVELIVPDHIAGVLAKSIVVAGDQRQATLVLQFATGQLGPFNGPLLVRATAMRDGHPYTAERSITIVPQQNIDRASE